MNTADFSQIARRRRSGRSASPFAYRALRAADGFTLRLSVPNAANSVLGTAALHLAQGVTRRDRTASSTIEVYPNAQIAKEQEAVNGLSQPASSISRWNRTRFWSRSFRAGKRCRSRFSSRIFAPACASSTDQIGAELFADLRCKGHRRARLGHRRFSSALDNARKPVVAPEDLKGLRIRIQAGPSTPRPTRRSEPVPVAIDLSEVFTALQQHTIDGVDISVDSVATSKYYTVTRHQTMWNSVMSVTPMIASNTKAGSVAAGAAKRRSRRGKRIVPLLALADRAPNRRRHRHSQEERGRVHLRCTRRVP